jgi:5'(3')-deoxyribonucleotidase
MKTIIFCDMDGVLADFDAAIVHKDMQDPPEMFVPGFFRNLAVTDGAKEAIAELLANPDYEIYIGSKMTSKAPNCATEKVEWIKEHFPALLRNMVLCCDKKLLRGHVLIDDDEERWGHAFVGTFIHFDHTNHAESWKKVVEILKWR